MKNVLIYTIFRNSENYINQYYEQVKNAILANSEYKFYISLYENDSTDNTKNLLKRLDWSFTAGYSVVCEDIGTEFFGSVKEQQRVKNLAAARNKAIEGQGFFKSCDYIIDIESDMRYSTDTFNRILRFKEINNLLKVDIVSAVSRLPNNKLYDTWATRRNSKEKKGNLHDDWESTPFGKYYSTCNGICLFDATPFHNGVRYGWYNDRFNEYDCDTSVICEEFHKIGYSEIYIDHNSICYHD